MKGIGVVAAACLAGCAPLTTGTRATPGTSDSPAVPWTRPPSLTLPEVRPIAATPELPEGVTLETLQEGVTLSLPQVLGIALQNNPVTRVPWAQARQAAAELGVAKSGFLPTLDLGVDLQHQRLAALGGQFDIEFSQIATAVSLSWLLIDFGGRTGRIEAAEGELLSANFTHHRAIHQLVLQVEEAYVELVNAKALLDAQEVIVDAAQTSFDAATAREAAGLGTRADVLQAQTALSQAKLDRIVIKGQIDSLQGALAASMGLPATLRVQVKLIPPELPTTELTKEIEPLVTRALDERPDLAAARAQIAAAGGRIRQARSARLPSVSFEGDWNPTYFFNTQSTSDLVLQNYTVGLSLQAPIFDGFSTAYAESSAREAQEAARAQADAIASQVVLEVWQAFVDLGTAAAALDTAADLVASARANFDVAQGRYREGVGSIIDLLAAQQALGNAQSAVVRARSGWYLSFARLAYATGGLLSDWAEASGEAPSSPKSPSSPKRQP